MKVSGTKSDEENEKESSDEEGDSPPSEVPNKVMSVNPDGSINISKTT